MTTRSDVTQDYFADPRIQTVAAPSTDYMVQDVVDTTRKLEDAFEGMTHPKLIDAAGKEDLGGGLSVAITATLQNNKIEFEARRDPAETGTVTTAEVSDSRGRVQLIDAAADFIGANVQPGSFVINFDDRSTTDVRRVVSGTQLECKALVGGIADDFGLGDNYAVFNIVQCEVGGGNLVAVDDNGDPLPAILPSAFTQVVIARSSTGTGASDVSSAVWGELVSENQVPGSFGEFVSKKLLTLAKFLGLK